MQSVEQDPLRKLDQTTGDAVQEMRSKGSGGSKMTTSPTRQFGERIVGKSVRSPTSALRQRKLKFCTRSSQAIEKINGDDDTTLLRKWGRDTNLSSTNLPPCQPGPARQPSGT